MKTVIMAGGIGSRISSLFPDIPKPLIEIENSFGVKKPVLQWEIESLAEQGFTDIILTVSHMHEKIEDFFGDGSKFGVKINYFIEDTPLGNAGALFKLDLDSDFLLLNADSVFDVDLNRFVEFHIKKKALVSLFTHPNSHPYDSGLVCSDIDGSVISWLTKEDKRPKWCKNRVNSGLHIISPSVLKTTLNSLGIKREDIGTEDSAGNIIRVDLDRQILKRQCGTHRMFAYNSPEYVKDMGTPERYKQVSNDFKRGLVTAKKLSNRQKAIFLDRDGTINVYKGFLKDIDEFELIDGVAEAIKKINESGFLAIVVTNQPVIARGELTQAQLDMIHCKLETLLGEKGAYIDGLYYCPHHPESGFAGEVRELKIDCDCRKPNPGMLFRASLDYNIDLNESWIIGDSYSDILAGKSAGCKTGLIMKKEDKVEIQSDLVSSDLKSIIDLII